MIFRNRGYLPHLENQAATYFVTFRLAGTIPLKIQESWKFERKDIVLEAERQGRSLSEVELKRLNQLQSKKIEEYLDSGVGECWLKDPLVATTVVDALKYFDGKRYTLHAWCIMPNHVHVVFTPHTTNSQFNSTLIPILHSWKSFTANKVNQILKRRGEFWQPEYYDHLIRNDEEFAHFVEYTLENPVNAGLCKNWTDWPYSGCSVSVQEKLDF